MLNYKFIKLNYIEQLNFELDYYQEVLALKKLQEDLSENSWYFYSTKTLAEINHTAENELFFSKEDLENVITVYNKEYHSEKIQRPNKNLNIHAEYTFLKTMRNLGAFAISAQNLLKHLPDNLFHTYLKIFLDNKSSDYQELTILLKELITKKQRTYIDLIANVFELEDVPVWDQPILKQYALAYEPIYKIFLSFIKENLAEFKHNTRYYNLYIHSGLLSEDKLKLLLDIYNNKIKYTEDIYLTNYKKLQDEEKNIFFKTITYHTLLNKVRLLINTTAGYLVCDCFAKDNHSISLSFFRDRLDLNYFNNQDPAKVFSAAYNYYNEYLYETDLVAMIIGAMISIKQNNAG